MSIGFKIKKLAEGKNVSISEMAKYTGKGRTTIYSYLNGKTSVDVDTLEKLSVLFKVPLIYFFNENQGYQDEYKLKLEEAQELIKTQKKLVKALEERIRELENKKE